MASILVDIEKGVEIGAEDLVKYLAKGETEVVKIEKKSPAALAAVGTILGAVNTAALTVESAASSGGVNFTLDAEAWSAIKTVWPDVVTLSGDLGIKL